MLAKTIFLLVLAAVAAATETGDPFKQMSRATNQCINGYEDIISPDTCMDARAYLKEAKHTDYFLGIDWADVEVRSDNDRSIEITPWVGDPHEPKGCSVRKGSYRLDRRKRKSTNIPDRMYFNTHGRGSIRSDMSPICKKKVEGPAIKQVLVYEIPGNMPLVKGPLSEMTELEIIALRRQLQESFASASYASVLEANSSKLKVNGGKLTYGDIWENVQNGGAILLRDIESVTLSQKEQATRGRRGPITIDATITLRSKIDQSTAANLVPQTFTIADQDYTAKLQSRNEIERCQWVVGKYLAIGQNIPDGLTEKTMPDAPSKEACEALVLEQEPSASGVTYNDGILDARGVGDKPQNANGNYLQFTKSGHGACTAIFGVTELHTPVSINVINDPGERFPVGDNWRAWPGSENLRVLYERSELTNAVYKSCKLWAVPTASPTLSPTTTSPTTSPTTTSPTLSPTLGPTQFPTSRPSMSPTASPTYDNAAIDEAKVAYGAVLAKCNCSTSASATIFATKVEATAAKMELEAAFATYKIAVREHMKVLLADKQWQKYDARVELDKFLGDQELFGKCKRGIRGLRKRAEVQVGGQSSVGK